MSSGQLLPRPELLSCYSWWSEEENMLNWFNVLRGKHYIHIMWCVGSTSYDVDISWWDIKILGSHHFLIFEETSLWCEPKWCVKLPSYVHITFFHPHHFLACLHITFPKPIKTRSVVSPTSKIPKVGVPLGFSWYIGHDTKVCPSSWEQEQLHEQQGHPLAGWQVLSQQDKNDGF